MLVLGKVIELGSTIFNAVAGRRKVQADKCGFLLFCANFSS